MIRTGFYLGALFVEAYIGALQLLPGWWDTLSVPFRKHCHHWGHHCDSSVLSLGSAVPGAGGHRLWPLHMLIPLPRIPFLLPAG